jgi:uncharacterized protein YecT (DUF1311 family)
MTAHRSIFTLLLLALLATAPFVRAEDEEKKHPIDAKVAALFDKAVSTHDMIQAAGQGTKLWDAELNRCYGELKKKLKPEAFTALQAAQRQWIAYRDAQSKALDEFYSQFDGTMYLPMRADAGMTVIRTRAMELYDMLEMLKEHAQ